MQSGSIARLAGKLIVNSKSKFSPIKTRIDYRGRIYLPIKVRRTL